MVTRPGIFLSKEQKQLPSLIGRLQFEISNRTLNSEIISWIHSGCCLFWILFLWYLALSITQELMYFLF